jgi:hypothetical protein
VQPLLLFFFFASDRRRSTFPSLPSPQPSPPLSLKKKKKISPSYVQQLQKSAQTGPKAGPTAEELRKQKKKLEEEQARELASLFACVAIKQPKLQPGVDPKSVVCEFFRAGQCAKGFKCKYSHDLAVERKTRKIDLFSDMRGGADGEEEEGMEDWDQGETREFSPPPPSLFVFFIFLRLASSPGALLLRCCPSPL